MATTKEYNTKIRSLKNTAKITSTMKMVSASKLRKAQDAQANAKLYARKITELISRLSSAIDAKHHPLLEKRSEVKNILILIFTSDKGLCGAFNNNANKRVHAWVKDNEKHYDHIDLSCCGKRGHAYFQRRGNIKNHYENVTANPSFSQASQIGKELADSYINGEYDEIYVTYNQFFSPLSQKTIFEKILPIDDDALESVQIDESAQNVDYIFEPKIEKLLSYLVPHYLYFRIHFALLENSAGEHGARMTAMDSASKNAAEMIDKYTLLKNRARQASITTELIEIVAGAEALK